MKILKTAGWLGLGLMVGMAVHIGDSTAGSMISPADPPKTKWIKNSVPGPVRIGEVGTKVFYYGADEDMDGVPDSKDKCPGTPKGVTVTPDGCPLDSDGDGVADYLDSCPDTAPGFKVDPKGCPVDSDGDNYYDVIDSCPTSPKGAPVDSKGCWNPPAIHFDSGKANIKKDDVPKVKELSEILNHNPTVNVKIQGNTDSVGSDASNKALSIRRANAAKKFLLDRDVERSQIKIEGAGEKNPVDDNKTKEGRANNRRDEFEPSVR